MRRKVEGYKPEDATGRWWPCTFLGVLMPILLRDFGVELFNSIIGPRD
jgi:hypothetical protein